MKRNECLQAFLATCTTNNNADIWLDPFINPLLAVDDDDDATMKPLANAAVIGFVIRSLNDFVTQFSTSTMFVRSFQSRYVVVLVSILYFEKKKLINTFSFLFKHLKRAHRQSMRRMHKALECCSFLFV